MKWHPIDIKKTQNSASNDWRERGHREENGLLGQGQLFGVAICKQRQCSLFLP